jgi:hypothetical protein
MSSVTFGETMKTWSDLMNRWQLYNREVYCRADLPRDSPTRGQDEYTVLTVIPDFPPFPGPAPIALKWLRETSKVVSDTSLRLTLGPYIDGTSLPDDAGALAYNFAYNMAPSAKFTLNAPLTDLPVPDETYVDMAQLLRVNPGQLTMMHFVSRMFLARKGAIRNKYILDGNTAPDNTRGTQIMSVKRLPDSGVISGTTYLGSLGNPADVYNNATTAEDTAAVRYSTPGFGGFWSQASCRIENATNASGTFGPPSQASVPNTVKAQALNGSLQTGASNSMAPNWFDPTDYPASPDYAPPLNSTTTVAGTVAKADLMMSNTYDGTHVTTALQQPVIEVEIPFYVNSRFVRNDLILNNTRGVQAHVLKYETHLETGETTDVVTEASTITYFERHVRPGSDFSLYYLANVPHIVMLGNFLYTTAVGNPNTGSTYALDTASYGSLRYRAGGRQSTSAYRAAGVTPVPIGTSSLNSVPADPYFYDVSVQAQAYPLNIPSSASV